MTTTKYRFRKGTVMEFANEQNAMLIGLEFDATLALLDLERAVGTSSAASARAIDYVRGLERDAREERQVRAIMQTLGEEFNAAG